VVSYAHGAEDPWSRDPLLEELLASFELDVGAALERGDEAIAIDILLSSPAPHLHRLPSRAG